MENLLDQIEKGINAELYHLSLVTSICIPDICGAIESSNGRASGEKYKKWFDKYLKEKYPRTLTADDCYAFRCSFLHQGKWEHENAQYERVLFVEPDPNYFHNNVINDALNIDLVTFCEDMIEGARKWLNDMDGNENYNKNVRGMFERYPNGLSPYIVGIPVYS